MVVANTPTGHAVLPDPKTLIYDEVEGGNRDEGRITGWEKVQEVRSGKVTLWDHCFELPAQAPRGRPEDPGRGRGRRGHPQAQPRTAPTSSNCTTTPAGTPSASTASIAAARNRPPSWRRSSRTTAAPLDSACRRRPPARCPSAGRSTCRQMVSGHKFTLERHFDADGDYVLTRVEHTATIARDGYRSGGDLAFEYENTFECIPRGRALPARTRHPEADRARDADRRRRRPGGRGDLHRQVRPREGPVPLGPRGQVRRRQLLLDPRRHDLGAARAGA